MVKEYNKIISFQQENMSLILNHMEENHKETQRLIGLDYEQLQKLIQNLEQLHNEKQDLLESNKTRIGSIPVWN